MTFKHVMCVVSFVIYYVAQCKFVKHTLAKDFNYLLLEYILGLKIRDKEIEIK